MTYLFADQHRVDEFVRAEPGQLLTLAPAASVGQDHRLDLARAEVLQQAPCSWPPADCRCSAHERVMRGHRRSAGQAGVAHPALVQLLNGALATLVPGPPAAVSCHARAGVDAPAD